MSGRSNVDVIFNQNTFLIILMDLLGQNKNPCIGISPLSPILVVTYTTCDAGTGMIGLVWILSTLFWLTLFWSGSCLICFAYPAMVWILCLIQAKSVNPVLVTLFWSGS